MNRIDWLSILIFIIHYALAIFGITIIANAELNYAFDIIVLCIVNNIVSVIIYSSFLVIKQSSFSFQTRTCISLIFGVIPHGLIIALLFMRTIHDDITIFLINNIILYIIQICISLCLFFNTNYDDQNVCLDCEECYEECWDVSPYQK